MHPGKYLQFWVTLEVTDSVYYRQPISDLFDVQRRFDLAIMEGIATRLWRFSSVSSLTVIK